MAFALAHSGSDRIVARNGRELDLALAERGMRPGTLFFKCLNPRAYSDSSLETRRALHLPPRREFEHLSILYDAFPERIARPVAIVVRRNGSIVIAGYIVEKIAGKSLSEYRPNETTTDIRPALQRYSELSSGLADVIGELHRRGLGHGDPNPDNVLVNGGIKLIDPSAPHAYGKINMSKCIASDERHLAALRADIRALHDKYKA